MSRRRRLSRFLLPRELSYGHDNVHHGVILLTLDDVMEIAKADGYLAVIATLRRDSTIQATVVNAGALPHPITGEQVVGFVTYGEKKLANLRSAPRLSITFRAGWRWATVEGDAELIGPDDPHPSIDEEALRLLRRAVFSAAGGSHDDWGAYDTAMTAERRSVVLVRPIRAYSNRVVTLTSK
jgi:PPOX class probable F420-dependent enzyme